VNVTLVGDADRDRALALLRRHYAEGRFDHEELTRRVDAAAGARSTTDVWVALRGLPNALLETVLAPRLLAAGTTLSAYPALRAARRLALAVIVSAAWLLATTLLAVTYAISLIVGGPSTIVAVIFGLTWLLVTWGSWRMWRRRTRRA
jgi:hypothetical protein